MESKQRIHKNKADYGLPDYFNFYSENIGNIDRGLFSKIITEFNKGVVDLIIEESLVFYIPYIGFEIMVKKDKRKPKIVNGKLINNVPIDWKATNELWDENEEAREKKLLVRYNNSHTSGYVFRIYCKKFKGNIKNKNLYKFKPNRKFQRDLSARIKDPDKDNFDAYLLYNKK